MKQYSGQQKMILTDAMLLYGMAGNNDFPFYKSDLMITVTDPRPCRPRVSYYPGETTLRMADVVVINKIDTSAPESIQIVRNNINKVNPNAIVIDAASVKVDNPSLIKGKKVLAVEDGPTLTHGGNENWSRYCCCTEIWVLPVCSDPRPYTTGKLSETFINYPNIGTLLPAMGYGEQQLKDLETTINNTPCDTVVIGTPIYLNRIIKINKPSVRVY